MESDPARQVAELQAHKLSVYRPQATPAWAWPSFAVAVFVYVSSYQLRRTWLAIVAPLVYAVFVGVWVGAVNKSSGVQPRLRGMPKPLLGELVRFWVAGAILAASVVAVGLATSFVLAGALAAVAILVGGRHFDRRYRRRADALLPPSPTPGT